MNRPSATTVRRTAADLSDQVAPHLAHARDTLVHDVMPKAKDTLVNDVMPKVNAGVHAGLAATEPARTRAKAAGTDLAIKIGAVQPPKKSHKLRTAMVLTALGAGAYAAWNAWRLPHASDDWVHADSTAAPPRTDTDIGADLPRVDRAQNGMSAPSSQPATG